MNAFSTVAPDAIRISAVGLLPEKLTPAGTEDAAEADQAIKVRIGNVAFDVVEISASGFRAEIPAEDVPLGSPFECEFFRPFNNRTIRARAKMVWLDAETGRTAFGFVAIADREKHALSRLISLTEKRDGAGRSEAIAANENRIANQRDTQMLASPIRKVTGYAFWSLCTIVLGSLLGLTLFNHLFTVTATSAAITAHAIEIRAPASGIVESLGVRAGDEITRDQKLLFVDDPDLAFELGKARASSNPEKVPNSHDGRLAAALLHALETRLARNTIYSPCDCVVHEIIAANGGEWAEPGDRLMVLIPNQPESFLIDARVTASDAGRLSDNQKVVLTFPMTGETIEGSVTRIVSQQGAGKRAGVPEWFTWDDGNVSVLVRPHRSISFEAVGQPVEMTTATMTLRGLANRAAKYAARLKNLAGFE